MYITLHHSFCRPLYIHIHKHTSRLNRLGHRKNLTMMSYSRPGPKILVNLPTRRHGVPLRWESASIAGFLVPEEPVLPADDGEHLIVKFRVSRLSLAERCMPGQPGCAVSVCATCTKNPMNNQAACIMRPRQSKSGSSVRCIDCDQ